MKNDIVIIAPEVFPVPPLKGGAVETWIHKVTAENKEAEISILSIQDDGLSIYEKTGNVRYFRYKKSWLDNLFLISYKLPFKNSKSFLYWFLYSFWSARICRKLGSEIIHIHNRWQFIPIIKRLNPKARILFHVHQLSALDFSEKQGGFLKSKIAGFIGCSNFIAKKIKEKFNLDQNKNTFTVRNGVDIKEFSSISEEEKIALKRKEGLENNKVIFFAGRLVKNKGADILIKAFCHLNNDKIKLLIVGGATYSDNTKTDYIRYLEDLARAKKDNILFKGFINHEDMPDLFKLSDVFVLPSEVEEGLPIVLIEAMSSGLAVMGSDRGGVSDLIDHNINGILVKDYTNFRVWAEKLGVLLKNEELRHKFGQKAREKVERNFTWKNISDNLEEVYASI